MTNPDFLSIVVRRERRGYLWQLLDGMVAVARGTAAQKKQAWVEARHAKRAAARQARTTAGHKPERHPWRKLLVGRAASS